MSTRNDCYFCANAHGAAASELLEGGKGIVDGVCASLDTADVSDKMRALLRVAGKVQVSGKEVTAADIAEARAAGADDEDIHDAVLIAAAFCMFNRYVDGLDAVTPRDGEAYDFIGKMLAAGGYQFG